MVIFWFFDKDVFDKYALGRFLPSDMWIMMYIKKRRR